ncbi:peptide deformylase [Candidatus Falkowbacteria bacterium RIFOXYC2_FULL_47_12]|uniref:Peptide deformylase n=2 Tax=Candidatus Falkowiibacteriota TaxID=1752728 RepID=A0A1F5TLL8_9BACT|nr:MAG: peptide deformylase [Candidatus Falkowbacteria bacterium RIFOXYA2_FULL_47_9]OGF39697.1 MAG: peptide deformylase [Candidatus Falkowbacteria bacterium RIFOXYC2_FULL_47_12]
MPKTLNIIIYPDKTLRVKCIEIKKVDDKIRRLISDMELTMKEKDGVGLAGPQVGQTIRVIIINTKDGPLAMVNPKITKKSWRKESGEEGCLSIPDFYGSVKRHKKINVIYTDKHNKKIKLAAEGLFARVIQHEIDHLNGVLFIDYLPKKNLKDLPEE